jgi:hypothetical protein
MSSVSLVIAPYIHVGKSASHVSHLEKAPIVKVIAKR